MSEPRVRYYVDLDRHVRFAERFRYAVGGGRISFMVPARAIRRHWWQFWRQSPHVYKCRLLFEAPLKVRLLEAWLKRCARSTCTTLKPWERGAPEVRFTSPAAREMLRREIQACLDGMQRLARIERETRKSRDDAGFFLMGRVIDEETVEIIHEHHWPSDPST